MKANEAPDKIYIFDNPILDFTKLSVKQGDDDIEYTRTDAFIEKALKWYCLDCECNDNCRAEHRCFFRQEYKRYLEGNENAIPPKFKNAINPDGSLTDNYQYRHFIRKMQDAFIERVCEWLNKNFNMPDDFKEHFKQALKGE